MHCLSPGPAWSGNAVILPSVKMESYNVFYSSVMSSLSLFVFLDGRPQWEVEAKIIREKSQGVSRTQAFYTSL